MTIKRTGFLEVIFSDQNGVYNNDKNMQKMTKIGVGFLPENGQF